MKATLLYDGVHYDVELLWDAATRKWELGSCKPPPRDQHVRAWLFFQAQHYAARSSKVPS